MLILRQLACRCLCSAKHNIWLVSGQTQLRHLTGQSFFNDQAQYDTDYYLNPANFAEIVSNIRRREFEDPDYQKVIAASGDDNKLAEIISQLLPKMPNRLDSQWQSPDNETRTVETIGQPPDFAFEPATAEELLQRSGLLLQADIKLGSLGLLAGKRSYSLVGDGRRLETAVLNWTMQLLINEYGFNPVVVPEVVWTDIIENCGFPTSGKRSQVYGLAGADGRASLIGTAEIPLVAYNIGQTISEEDLPVLLCSMSRCYRAEAPTNKLNAGLYRVHWFNKVEMLALTTPEKSSETLQRLVDIQKRFFSDLRLPIRVVDMPPSELGLPAARKFDIECYLPGRKFWAELSSASNCTDFQSRRFNIKCRKLIADEETDELFRDRFVHTLNGTGCATPRILIAIIENNQREDGSMVVPEVLRPYIDGQEVLRPTENLFPVKKVFKKLKSSKS